MTIIKLSFIVMLAGFISGADAIIAKENKIGFYDTGQTSYLEYSLSEKVPGVINSALIEADRGNYVDAANLFSKISFSGETGFMAVKGYVDCMMRIDRYVEAESFLRKINNASIKYYGLGLLSNSIVRKYQDTNRKLVSTHINKAENYTKKALAIDNDRLAIVALYGSLALFTDPRPIRSSLEKYLNKHPKVRNMRFLLTSKYLAYMGYPDDMIVPPEYEKALGQLKILEQAQPAQPDISFFRGVIYGRKGQVENAKQQFQIYVDSGQNNENRLDIAKEYLSNPKTRKIW